MQKNIFWCKIHAKKTFWTKYKILHLEQNTMEKAQWFRQNTYKQIQWGKRRGFGKKHSWQNAMEKAFWQNTYQKKMHFWKKRYKKVFFGAKYMQKKLFGQNYKILHLEQNTMEKAQ